MAIKAIYWDIGGVLVRTVDREPRARLAEKLGLTYAQLEDAVFNAEPGRKAQLGLLPAEMVWQSLIQRFGLPATALAAFQEAFFGGDVLDEALVDHIRRLHLTYRTGVISNAFDNARHLLMQVWRVGDAFDDLVISAEVGVMKPDPQIYQIALRGLGVLPQEAVFLDDALPNIQGARDIGMHAIHFRHPEQALQDLHALLRGQDCCE